MDWTETHGGQLLSGPKLIKSCSVCQEKVCFFTADLASWFHLKLQSVAVMTSSRKCLLEDEIEQSLLEDLTASDQSSSSDDDDSSGTDDLT